MNSKYNALSESSPQLYTEMYYGKKEDFEACEKLFAAIRRKLLSTKKYQYINEFPENKLLEQQFQKIFGFKKVHIHWEYKNIPNAYTIIGSHLYNDPRRKTTAMDKKNGYYDSTHSDVLFVCLYAGLLTGDIALTDDEMMGVVLHEIGHNFDYSIFNTISAIVKTTLVAVCYGAGAVGIGLSTGIGGGIIWAIMGIIQTVAIAFNSTYEISNKVKDNYYNAVDKRERIEMKYPYHKKAEEELCKISDKLRIWYTSKDSVIRTLTNIALAPFHIIASPILQFMDLSSKTKEQFADSFATAYGLRNNLSPYKTSLIAGTSR